MYAKLLGLVLFACQIILNGSHVIREATDDVSVINGTPTLAPATSKLPKDYVKFPRVHVAYKVYPSRVHWLRARELCIAEGADLAIADTLQKIQYIRSLHLHNEEWISIGIRRLNTTDEWVRVDNNLPVATVPWTAGNPSYDGDCTGISIVREGILNYPCDFEGNWYACEIPI